jgi:hypothetical protein
MNLVSAIIRATPYCCGWRPFYGGLSERLKAKGCLRLAPSL